MGGKVDGFQKLFSCKNYSPKNEYTRRIFNKISRCHTSAFGYHYYECDNPECKHRHIQYHCCGNRHCPFCGSMKKEEWVEARIADLLPIPYYHSVITVPHEFNGLILANRKEMFDLLFKSASETLLNHGNNKEFLGGTPGIIMILHTWGQRLDFHVHVHCIVTGGGISDSDKWIPPKRANGKFLFPVPGLKKMYKGIFLKKLREIKSELKTSQDEIDKAIKQSGYKKWKVYSKAPFGGPEQVIRYLGRYTHKTAITRHRIISVKQEKVRFSYKDYNDMDKWKEMELSEHEFLRRFEQHILPKRFVKIRYYGFLQNHGKKQRLTMIRKQLKLKEPPPAVEIPVSVRMLEKFGKDVFQCEQCKTGRYQLVFTIRYGKMTFPRNKASPVSIEVESHE